MVTSLANISCYRVHPKKKVKVIAKSNAYDPLVENPKYSILLTPHFRSDILFQFGLENVNSV